MAYVFEIFSIVGWAWAVVFGLFLLVQRRRRGNTDGGAGAVVHHEK